MMGNIVSQQTCLSQTTNHDIDFLILVSEAPGFDPVRCSAFSKGLILINATTPGLLGKRLIFHCA